MLIKAQYLRNGRPAGNEYTYRSNCAVKIGDAVKLPNGATAVVSAVNVPEEEVAAFADKVKSIVGKCEESEDK